MPRVDWLIIGPAVFMVALGLVVLRSIELTARIPIDFNLETQLVAVLLAVTGGVFAYKLKNLWPRLSGGLYLVALLVLGLVLLVGEEAGGARRWIDLGAWQFQPSELAKLSLIIIQAKLLATRKNSLNRPWPLVLSAVYTLVLTGLVLAQPDLGTAALLVLVWLAQLLGSNLSRRTLLLLLGFILLAIPTTYPFLADYQKDRINSFLHPSLDTSGDGYNALQATIAIGSGGLLGKGLDAGTQSQLNFLPSQHTDFIFAVIGEKLGFAGAFLVVVAACLLLLQLAVLTWRAESDFVRLVGIGVVTVLAIQFFINMGMNLGLAPITGVPLPLISAGGTHLVIEGALIGMALGLFRKGQKLYSR
ncbi:MAG TPA: FtsW/RodA/SpoVE family cell cycle protein [Candidatus Saccharimonadales bacterium]